MTMKILTPIDITGANLTAINILEDDYPAWDVATTYAQGDFAISTATHTVYRSLTAGNVGNDPDLEQAALADPLIIDPDPIEWQVIGATDPYKPFDGRPTQTVTNPDSITFTILPGQFVGGVAAFGVSAETVTIEMVDDGSVVYSTSIDLTDDTVVYDWFSYFYEPITELSEFVLTDLPPYQTAEINVTFGRPGGDVTLGQFLVGTIYEAGVAKLGSTGFSGLDFSYVQTNDFGDLVTVQREATRLSDYEVFINSAQLLSFDNRMKSLRGGVPAVWIGCDNAAIAATNYGFYRDYRAVYQTTDYAIINIQVQGIV